MKTIDYEYIRYYDSVVDAWVLFKDNDNIKIDKNNELKILIKVNIETKIQKKIYDEFKNINCQIDNLSEKILNKYSNNNDKIKYDDSKLDIAILTANPLIEKIGDEIKELSSMNDFNNITNSIHNTIIHSNKLISAQFLPLTINNLKEVIYLKPKIIHLICKSTYIINDDKNNINNNDKKIYEYVNLIFEDNDYFEMKVIKKDDLDSIFEEKKIKNTSLIISTQLSHDTYSMVKDYKFQNILVQPTTIANSLFIADFNEHFYNCIIEQNNNFTLNDCFDYAINMDINFDLNHFCCCFHEHLTTCKNIRNYVNELYINDINKNEIECMPHFYHLRYE